jgi:hypothetical protein
MDIQLSTNIRIAIAMDEAEARAFLVSPANLQAKIRRQLALAHGGKGNGHRRNGKVAAAPKVAAREEPKAKPIGGGKGARSPCPKCGVSLSSRGFLERHLRLKHPAAATAAAG